MHVVRQYRAPGRFRVIAIATPLLRPTYLGTTCSSCLPFPFPSSSSSSFLPLRHSHRTSLLPSLLHFVSAPSCFILSCVYYFLCVPFLQVWVESAAWVTTTTDRQTGSAYARVPDPDRPSPAGGVDASPSLHLLLSRALLVVCPARQVAALPAARSRELGCTRACLGSSSSSCSVLHRHPWCSKSCSRSSSFSMLLLLLRRGRAVGAVAVAVGVVAGAAGSRRRWGGATTVRAWTGPCSAPLRPCSTSTTRRGDHRSSSSSSRRRRTLTRSTSLYRNRSRSHLSPL